RIHGRPPAAPPVARPPTGSRGMSAVIGVRSATAILERRRGLPAHGPAHPFFLMSIKEATRPPTYCAGKSHAAHGRAMTSISEFLTAEHRHGDELFAAASHAVDRNDRPACRERFGAFHESLRRHMAIEEQVLFPAFEQATGIAAGPTRVMRDEHQEMLA